MKWCVKMCLRFPQDEEEEEKMETAADGAAKTKKKKKKKKKAAEDGDVAAQVTHTTKWLDLKMYEVFW